MKDNYKKLFENIGIFAIANFTSRILSFLILPLYTYYLTTEEYGTIDLINTGIQLIFPIISLAISDAVLRFGISHSNEQDKVLGVGVKIMTIGMVPLTVIALILGFIMSAFQISVLLCLIYFFQTYNTLFSNYAKSIDKTKEMALISSSISILILALNVLLVARFKLGVQGYLLSMLLSNALGFCAYIYFCKIYNYFRLSNIFNNSDLTKMMLSYSIPLIPNAIFWWINSSLDRWALTFLSSIANVGLYACANKIPTIVSTLNTIFSQAWNLSLFQSNKEARNIFFSKTYFYFNELLFCCTIGIILLSKPIAQFMFSGEFFIAWKLVPILTFGVYYNSLNAFLGSLFTANNQTNYIFVTTLAGSLTNLLLNVPFIILWDVEGAALATLISYLAVWLIRIIKQRQLYNITLSFVRSGVQFFILIVLNFFVISEKLQGISILIVITYYIVFAYKLWAEIRKKHYQ